MNTQYRENDECHNERTASCAVHFEDIIMFSMHQTTNNSDMDGSEKHNNNIISTKVLINSEKTQSLRNIYNKSCKKLICLKKKNNK